MNLCTKPAHIALALLALGLAVNSSLAQPYLTVSPSVTSNTYTGVITLGITGLTNGEQVIVRKYLDLDGNGSIDAGEPLVDTFKITDGGVTVVAGVTNVNVPYDTDSGGGSISTFVNFLPQLVVETMVAHYVYQVASPSGRFTPVTASFVVTNGVQTQSVAGTVYANGVPLPHAIVVAQDQQANDPMGGTVADINGHYFLTLPPSSYTLIATVPNYYYSFNLAPSVTLTNGMAATNDLYLTNGTVLVTGRVYDAASSNGIAGVLLTLQSGPWFAVSFTDTNGSYAAAVAPSFWKVQVAKERLARRAYVYPQLTLQADATAGNASNANIALPRGNALFYGRITDNSGHTFANARFDGGANGSINYGCKGYSDAQGNYAVAVLGDVTSYWFCGANSGKNTALANYVLNSYPTVTMSPNQTRLQNFVALPATGVIHGQVQDNSGNPVTGVTLTAGAMINGANYQALDATTDSSGNYSMPVAGGQWSLQFLTGGFSDNLDTHGYVDPYGMHMVSVPPNDVLLNLTVYPIGTPLMSAAQRSGPSQFAFNISGASNVSYTVQVSTNVLGTNWNTLFSFVLTNNPFPVVDQHATNSPRYYRVLKN